MADEYDYLFKSIVVGDGGVGKTALTLRFSKGFFTEDYKMTIGVDFHVKTIKIDTEEEGQILVKLQIWDTGGQERFSSIRPMYYRGALGALLIFDLTSYESFEHLPQWIEEIRANVKSEVPLLLVGNKSDLMDLRTVSLEEIDDFTEKFNLYYMETSAKTGDGVGDCFYILACLMVGSGVPDQLVSKGIVFSPGNVLAAISVPASKIIAKEKPAIDVSTPSFEPEPEIDFSAPPVPEPPSAKPFEPAPKFESKIHVPEPEIENHVEKPLEFEFKTPDQILAEEIKEEESQPIFNIPKFSEDSQSPTYKPKTIPFAASFPTPAPTPEAFKTPESSSDSLVDYMPETILSKKEKKKLEKQRKKEEKEKARLEKEKQIDEEKERERLEREKARLEKEKQIEEEKERERLKREKARLEKEKAKEEKERKLQEKRQKAAKMKEEMQRVGKEKKKKKEKVKEVVAEPAVQFPTAEQAKSTSGASNFFQAISEKTNDSIPSSPFIPFTGIEKTKSQEVSTLKTIPNVADIISAPISSPKIPSETSISDVPNFPAFQQPAKKEKKTEIIICKQCGAMLSSDYAFCNKCGGKL